MDDNKKESIKWWFLWLLGWWFTVGYGLGLDMVSGAETSTVPSILWPLLCLPLWPIILGMMAAGGGV